MGALRMQKGLAGQGERAAPMPHTLAEVFPTHPSDAGATAFLLSRFPRTNTPILRVQDRRSRKEVRCHALPGLGWQHWVIMMDLSRKSDRT